MRDMLNFGLIKRVRQFFSLGSRSNSIVSTVITSRRAYQKNIGTDVAISISAGTGEYRINGGSWVSTDGTISDGDYLEARLTSSASYDTAVSLVIDIGTGDDTFAVTTMSDPITFIVDGPDNITDGSDFITDGA